MFMHHQNKTDDLKDSFYGELESVFDKFLKYYMNILLGDVTAKIGRKDIFKPAIGNKSLYEINIDNGARVVNCATSKNLIVRMFPHCNIHKFTWTSPNGKTIRLTIFCKIENCIQMYLPHLSGEQTVIPLSDYGKS
jgi:hypothetical protein